MFATKANAVLLCAGSSSRVRPVAWNAGHRFPSVRRLSHPAIQAMMVARPGAAMKLGLIARLRRYRRPAVMIAAGLIAVQAFLAGSAIAQAALMRVPNLAGDAAFAVICHGNGGSDSNNGSAPEPGEDHHPCCVSCVAGAPPATLPEQLIALRSDCGRVFKSPSFYAASIPIAPRAVRAGASRAPPSLA
jgi:hypothetical protein